MFKNPLMIFLSGLLTECCGKFFRSCRRGGTNLKNMKVIISLRVLLMASGRVLTQVVTRTCQVRGAPAMYSIPHREMVAGVAVEQSSVSKI